MNWYKKARAIDKASINNGIPMYVVCQYPKCGRLATHPTKDYTENRDEWVWKSPNELDGEEEIAFNKIKNKNSSIQLSHGMCPDCFEKEMSQAYEYLGRKKPSNQNSVEAKN